MEKAKLVKHGGRDLIVKVLADWRECYGRIYDRLEAYCGRVEKCSPAEVLVPLGAAAATLEESTAEDDEDCRIAVGEYLYQLYCAKTFVKYLTRPDWVIAAVELEAHFWSVVELYSSQPARPLNVRLEHTGMSKKKFLDMIEQS